MRIYITLGIFALSVSLSFPVLGVEYSHDAQVGDLVQITLQDGSSFTGDLVELNETRLAIDTEEGRVVLLRESISDMLVIPRIGQQVRLTMVDESIYEGRWAGEDAKNVYVEGAKGTVALLKSQVNRIDVVRAEAEEAKRDKSKPRDNLITIMPTVDQLGWFAYGAPIKTFQAMGCEEEARSVQTWFTVANVAEILSGLALMAASREGLSSQARIEASILWLILDVGADLIRNNQRESARKRATDIANRHLAGQQTCMRTLKPENRK